ncbi:hypothetical protein ABPG75_001626 [Micractinium tetrahymenae]
MSRGALQSALPSSSAGSLQPAGRFAAAGAQVVAAVPELASLDLSGVTITGLQLRALLAHTQLTQLRLSNCHGQAFKAFKQLVQGLPSLQSLKIEAEHAPAGLQHLSPL